METMWNRYAPKSDLAGMAVGMADRIDTSTKYLVTEFHVSSLPEVWLGGSPRSPRDIPARGCVSFSALLEGGDRWGDGLLFFLAELESPVIATLLESRGQAGSTIDRPRMAAAAGSILLLIIGGSSTVGQPPVETSTSLRVMLEDLLRETATES